MLAFLVLPAKKCVEKVKEALYTCTKLLVVVTAVSHLKTAFITVAWLLTKLRHHAVHGALCVLTVTALAHGPAAAPEGALGHHGHYQCDGHVYGLHVVAAVRLYRASHSVSIMSSTSCLVCTCTVLYYHWSVPAAFSPFL